MLKILRKKKIVKRVLWGITIVLIPSFLAWQAGARYKKGKLTRAINIGEHIRISSQEFAKNLKDAEVGLFLNYFNQPEIMDRFKSDKQLLIEGAYRNLILKSIAKRADIRVPDKEVVKFISAHPLFNKKGKFDNKLYNRILQYTLGLMPRHFEESVRSFLVNSKLKDEFTKDVTVSEEDVLLLYKNEQEKVKLCYISIDKNELKDTVMVSEDEIASFYDSNKIFFKEKISPRVNPEEKLSASIAGLIKNEKARESAQKKAAELYDELKTGNIRLEELARRHNLKPQTTEFVSRYDNIEGIGQTFKIVETAFNLKEGNALNPIEIKDGFVIIEPVEFQPINTDEFEKEKEDYRENALAIKRMRIFDNWIKDIAVNYSFDIAAEEL